MKQDVLECAVAAATGESLREIRRRGFSSAQRGDFSPMELEHKAPQVIDWDDLDVYRLTLFP